MIVKDEAHVIRETLENIWAKIPLKAVVICDTGSSDDTVDIVRDFFKDKPVDGRIYFHEWKDFAHNRNLALQLSRACAEYSFIFDADDVLHGNVLLELDTAVDAYRIKFGRYERPLLVRNDRDFMWVGVLHECLVPTYDKAVIETLPGDYTVESRQIGNRSRNPNKYAEDAALLKKAMTDTSPNDHLYSRYRFYLAQSYKDCGNIKGAEAVWKECLNDETQWAQERYAAGLYLYQGTLDPLYLFKILPIDEERVEAVIELMNYFLNQRNYLMVAIMYRQYRNAKPRYELRNKVSLGAYEDSLIHSYYLRSLVRGYEFDKALEFMRTEGDLGQLAEVWRPLCQNMLSSSRKEIVMFYTHAPEDLNPWNYGTSQTSCLGGSETAVAYTAKNVGEMYPDAIVIVTGAVKTQRVDNVYYIDRPDADVLLAQGTIKTLICSRTVEVLTNNPTCRPERVMLWLHDADVVGDIGSPSVSSRVDEVICLTKAHSNLMAGKYPHIADRIRVVNNGLDIDMFPHSDIAIKEKNSFMYSSRPDRGLMRLLDIWLDVRNALPGATLKICSYVPIDGDTLSQSLKDAGVSYLGALSKSELYDEMAKTEYWMYPTSFFETSCITALEAQMSGMICMHTDIGGIGETLGGLGITIEHGDEVRTLAALESGELEEMRRRGISHAKRCDWCTKAEQLMAPQPRDGH